MLSTSLRQGIKTVFSTATRNINTSRTCLVEEDWRYAKGLPRNPNAYGPLTDGRDFTFLDGRPTPIGVGQRKRLEKHKGFAEKVAQVVKEMDFAVERAARIANEKEQHNRKALEQKLKPKGHLMLSSKK